ncbi:MAG: DUF1360 domain-containing protein [Solirubrobacteraceae bacterium]
MYAPNLISENEQRPLPGYAALAAAYAGFFGGGLALAARRGRELPDRFSAHDIALYGVATHRLSRMLSREKLGRLVRIPFTEVDEDAPTPPGEMAEHPRDGGSVRRAVGELVNCTLCLDQWVAAGFVLGHVAAPRVTRAVAAALTVKATADVLHIGYARAVT